MTEGEQMNDAVQVRRVGAILEVTLDRPKANAIDLATSRVMGDVFAATRSTATTAWAGSAGSRSCRASTSR